MVYQSHTDMYLEVVSCKELTDVKNLQIARRFHKSSSVNRLRLPYMRPTKDLKGSTFSYIEKHPQIERHENVPIKQ